MCVIGLAGTSAQTKPAAVCEDYFFFFFKGCKVLEHLTTVLGYKILTNQGMSGSGESNEKKC